MKSKPNIDAFLEGGAATERQPKAAAPARRSAAGAAAPTEVRKQVVMQLPITLINDLKRRALEQSVSSGKRVTQQQIVEAALKKFIYR